MQHYGVSSPFTNPVRLEHSPPCPRPSPPSLSLQAIVITSPTVLLLISLSNPSRLGHNFSPLSPPSPLPQATVSPSHRLQYPLFLHNPARLAHPPPPLSHLLSLLLPRRWLRVQRDDLALQFRIHNFKVFYVLKELIHYTSIFPQLFRYTKARPKNFLILNALLK